MTEERLQKNCQEVAQRILVEIGKRLVEVDFEEAKDLGLRGLAGSILIQMTRAHETDLIHLQLIEKAKLWLMPMQEAIKYDISVLSPRVRAIYWGQKHGDDELQNHRT